MKSDHALIVTAQALSITSQLLAIGIEIGIIAGGYLVYQKVKKEFEAEPEKTNISKNVDPNSVVLVPVSTRTTFKERWDKAKKIVRAFTE